jgi:hypothetical protein
LSGGKSIGGVAHSGRFICASSFLWWVTRGLHWHFLQWRTRRGRYAVNQVSKLGQGCCRRHDLADVNGATRSCIGHPCGQPGNGAVGQLAEDILASRIPGCSTKPQILAEQRVPAVLNSDRLQIMDIMFRARPAAARPGWRGPSPRKLVATATPRCSTKPPNCFAISPPPAPTAATPSSSISSAASTCSLSMTGPWRR